jgi:hypothetical protein
MSIIGRRLRIVLVVVVCLVGPMSARGGADTHEVWISTDRIQFPPELKPEVDEMLRRSPTFRAQYWRIAEARSVLVGVQIDPRLCDSQFRARTTFRRYQSGLLVVAVSISPGSHQGEWLAHEFEHILEQLDGRNLSRQATDRTADVWFSGTAVIETGRAIRAGHAVRDELQQPQAAQ